MFKFNVVESCTQPELIKELQGKLLLSFSPVEVLSVVDDVEIIKYKYIQLSLPLGTPLNGIEEAVKGYYTEQLELLYLKTFPSVVAAHLNTAIDWDEALLINYEFECSKLQEEMWGVLNQINQTSHS